MTLISLVPVGLHAALKDSKPIPIAKFSRSLFWKEKKPRLPDRHFSEPTELLPNALALCLLLT